MSGIAAPLRELVVVGTITLPVIDIGGRTEPVVDVVGGQLTRLTVLDLAGRTCGGPYTDCDSDTFRYDPATNEYVCDGCLDGYPVGLADFDAVDWIVPGAAEPPSLIDA